ncbi:MAG: asparaginase [Curvibacter sp.]|nr:MAG: asparaginase [Curvibacter sp.]
MTSRKVVVLGTGGTIAGRANSGSDNVGYKAGEVSVADLLAAVPGMSDRLRGCELVSEQIAQIDSKDMEWSVWRALQQACLKHFADQSVAGIVITHGTDTLEETAYFLHLCLASVGQGKPVVLTCAMRPSTALTPDGPQNILDAVTVALDSRSTGVLAVCAGAVHGAQHVQKAHTYRVDAFDSGDAGPLAWVEEGSVRWCQSPLPAEENSGSAMAVHIEPWQAPRVEIVMNYAGAGDSLVNALCSMSTGAMSPLKGIVVAGTGNGTVNAAMQVSLESAASSGIQIALASRCAKGGVVRASPLPDGFRTYAGLSAVKARVRLMLELMMSATDIKDR